jgi:hypothetical protein
MKCNKTQGKWCKNKHGASKIIDTVETYHLSTRITSSKPRGSNTIHTLLFKFYDKVKVLYDQASVSKSSITVDTAFQKDLTLQGCTTLPTCDDHLHSHMTSFRETLAEW